MDAVTKYEKPVVITGVVAIQDADSMGETFVVAGIDYAELTKAFVKLSFGDAADDVVGYVSHVWPSTHNDKPCLRADVVLLPSYHSKYAAVVHKTVDLLGFGVGGRVIERDGARLLRTSLSNLTLKVGYVHPAYKVEVVRNWTYDEVVKAIEDGVTQGEMNGVTYTKCYLGKREMEAFNNPDPFRIVIQGPPGEEEGKRLRKFWKASGVVDILPTDAESEIRFER